MVLNNDTIVALVTPQGRSGVAVLRISGPKTKKICQKITKKSLNPRYAYHSFFYDHNEDVLDEGLAIYFQAPHSFTGEDVLELQSHGSPVVVDYLLKRAIQLGARLAMPGEFSKRAFLNDKIDLTQAEAIADLINATSEQAARSAIRSLQGQFSNQINQLVDTIIHLRVNVEATIDFPDEDIDFFGDDKITSALTAIIDQLHAINGLATQGALLNEGLTVVIAGKPNVGKSTLLNRLSAKDRAIVTEVAGTTRDVLHEDINIDGLPLRIIDTAGLHDSDDVIEKLGIERAKKAITRADVILLVVDACCDNIADFSSIIADKSTVVIVNKIDLLDARAKITTCPQSHMTKIYLSAKHDIGIDLLREQLKATAGFRAGEGVFIARRRHLTALNQALKFLLNGQKQLQQNQARELLAEDLRQAQLALSEITGAFTADNLLDAIFSSFCIGK